MSKLSRSFWRGIFAGCMGLVVYGVVAAVLDETYWWLLLSVIAVGFAVYVFDGAEGGES